MLSYLLRKVFPQKAKPLAWRWVDDPDETWRFHMFQPYYLAEDEYDYWLIHKFDGEWTIKSCSKCGTEWGQWMGGCSYCFGFRTVEEAQAYAQAESNKHIERHSHESNRI